MHPHQSGIQIHVMDTVQMPLQIGLLIETPVTHTTGEVLLSCVNHHVPGELAGRREQFTTHRAFREL